METFLKNSLLFVLNTSYWINSFQAGLNIDDFLNKFSWTGLCVEIKFRFNSMATFWFNGNGDKIFAKTSFRKFYRGGVRFVVNVLNTVYWEPLLGHVLEELHKIGKKMLETNSKRKRLKVFRTLFIPFMELNLFDIDENVQRKLLLLLLHIIYVFL